MTGRPVVFSRMLAGPSRLHFRISNQETQIPERKVVSMRLQKVAKKR